MPLLDKLEDYLAKPGHLSRRSFVGKIVKGCLVLSGVVAGAGIGNVAFAANVLCCNLAWPHNLCPSDGCPCYPANEYTWSCLYNGCHVVCGECYNCQCSFYYFVCSPGCPCTPGAPTLESFQQMNMKFRAAGEKCH
jgi:hypothetical protein